MARMKGAELIAEFLIRERIPYLFGICGHGNVGMLDALYDVRDKMKVVSPRDEQTAAHMADGYFRVEAALAPTSFLLVPACRIYGGMALVYWFNVS